MLPRRLPTLSWSQQRAFYRNIPGVRLRPIPITTTQFDKVVYILGLGSLGKLIAHSLRKSFPHLPITIIFRRWSLASDWQRCGAQIELVTNGVPDVQRGFEYEVQEEPQAISRLDMRNLVVATKTYDTRGAVAPYVGRLSPASSVLFLQNGMGSVDEAASLFKPALKPKLYAGIVNHGVYSTGPFSAVHAGLADISMGLVPRPARSETLEDASGGYLMQLMLNCKPLACRFLPESELLGAQLKKLAVNAVINPLTVIFDCLNGELFKSDTIDQLIRALVGEISAVFIALLRSQKQSTPEDQFEQFSPDELYKVVRDIGGKTALNISSMRQDYIHRRTTEINYINGYIVRRARALGISCPINSRLVDLVLKRTIISEADIPTTFNIP